MLELLDHVVDADLAEDVEAAAYELVEDLLGVGAERRPAQRNSAGVRDNRATGPCMTMPSTSMNIAAPARAGRLQLAHRVDGRDRGLGLLERGQHLGRRARADPRRYRAVELLAVRSAALERREPFVVADAEQLEHALRDRLGRRRDRDPHAVGALVRAARH